MLAQPASDLWPELRDPASNGFVGNIDSAFGEQIFYVSMTEIESVV